MSARLHDVARRGRYTAHEVRTAEALIRASGVALANDHKASLALGLARLFGRRAAGIFARRAEK